MNQAHLHLILNHFPIAGLLVSTIFLCYGVATKQKAITQFALLVTIVISLMAIVVNQTGEGAEEIVEEIAGISHDVIHEHEEAAEKGIWAVILLGLVSTVAFVLNRREHKSAILVSIIALVLSIASFGAMAWVGDLGGKIRHAEEIGATVSSHDHDESEHHGSEEPDDD